MADDDDDLVFYVPFNIICHYEMMNGCLWKALCNEAPYSHEVNFTSSRIQTQDLVIKSREC